MGAADPPSHPADQGREDAHLREGGATREGGANGTGGGRPEGQGERVGGHGSSGEGGRGAHAAREDPRDLAAASACTACSLLVYLGTLYPHVPGGDSGELIASAYQLGIAHPPGYPLFNLIGKIFCSLLRNGNVAWRMNVGMAVVGACATGVLYLVAKRLVSNPWAAALGSGLFALNPIVWQYSTHAEVFPLNNALVATLLYLTVRFHETTDPSIARWGAFVMGLGLTNQHTIVLYEAPLALSVLIVGRNTLFKPRHLFSLIFYFSLGFSVYLYLPLATLRSPYVSWGDGLTVSGFLRHILRTEYGSFRLSADEKEPGRLLEGLEFYLYNLAETFPPGAPLLALIGACAAAARPTQHATLLTFTGAWLFYLLFFHALANLPLRNRLDHLGVMQRFWMQSAAIECLLMAAGAAQCFALTAWLLHRAPPEPRATTLQSAPHAVGDKALSAAPHESDRGGAPRRAEARKTEPGKASEHAGTAGGAAWRARTDALLGAAWGGAVVIVLAWWGLQRYAQMDQAGNEVVFQFAGEVLRGLPPYALFLTMTDLVTNALRYAQVCHHMRQDVLIVDQNLLSSEWFVKTQAHNFPGVAFPRSIYWPSREDGFDMRELLDVNYGKFRVFTFAGAKDSSHEAAGYRAVPFGYAEELVRPMDPENLTPWQVNFSMWAETVESHMPRPPPYLGLSLAKYPEGTWEYKAVEEYFVALGRYGHFAFDLIKEYPRSALPACIHIFSLAVQGLREERCNCSMDAHAVYWKSLGSSHFHASQNGIGDVLEHKLLMRDAWVTYVEKVEQGFMGDDERGGKDMETLKQILKRHEQELAALGMTEQAAAAYVDTDDELPRGFH